MQKRTLWQSIAIAVIFALLFVNWSGGSIAESTGGPTEIVSTRETPLTPSGESEGTGTAMPRDITFGTPTLCTLKTSTTPYYAPYGSSISAPTGHTLSAGANVYVVSRDYDYFYICWYINGKEMYGYVPMSAVNAPASYVWTQYDVYRPGTCTATTPVLSNAGTTNTYVSVGEIYAGENPLMVLGRKTNQYNNITYYYVQYHTSSGLVKRGWIDSSLGRVSIQANYTLYRYYDSGPFYIYNYATGKALTWDRSTNTLIQKTINGSLEQFFFFEKVGENASVPGYGFVRILSAADINKALTVQGNGYTEGLQIIMSSKASVDKKQEFLIDFSHLSSDNICSNAVFSKILTRSTGEYRGIEVFGGSSAENTKIIQSKFVNATNQRWNIVRVTPHWNQTFGQGGGTSSPVNRNVHYDSSLNGYVSFNIVQESTNRWNAAYNFSMQTITGGHDTFTNCLTTIVKGTISERDIIGYCSPVTWSSGQPIYYAYEDAGSHVNEKWFSTRIILDTSKFEDYSDEELRGLVCHEMGHSLKMSHTYMQLIYSNSTYSWIVKAYPVSIMSQGRNPGTFTPAGIGIDEYRIARKWNGV